MAIVLHCLVLVKLKKKTFLLCFASFTERRGIAMRRGADGEECSRDMHSFFAFSALVALMNVSLLLLLIVATACRSEADS
jgi:hypothetical protein